MKLRKRYRLKKSDFLILVIISLLFLTSVTIRYVGKNMYPTLLAYGEIEAEKMASIIINKCISRNEIMELDIDSLFIISRDDNGKITTIDFNTIVANKLMLEITTKVQKYLKYIEYGDIENIDFKDDLFDEYEYQHMVNGVFYEIPIGTIFNNPILSNLGPKIPVKFSVVGNISTSLENSIKSYGINNGLLEIKLHVQLTEKIIIPFNSKKIVIEEELPLAIKIIQGEIPDYYLNNKLETDTLNIPVE